MYQKRNSMPREWPVERKGTKYITLSNHSSVKSIPLLVVLRDILGIAKTKREAKYILFNEEIKVNNKIRKDEKYPVQAFDSIHIEKLGKNYKMIIENKKFKLVEVSDAESNKKIIKIIGKKLLGKGVLQMNLEDGQNILTKDKFSVNDSIVMNTKDNKIVKILPLKEGANIEVISGKHAGEKGKLKSINVLERGKKYLIKLKEKEVELPIKTILVID